ncbi:Sec20-domain-containing protein, partial [Metschnikowia bicuspidata var. bicuspidata NRRL YB-4993]
MGFPPANLELESIKCLFGEIDDLQSQVLLQISRISKRSSSDDTEPVQIFREKTVKTATTLIHKIADLLRVTDLKILRIPAIAASEHYLHETLDLYNGKVKHLRRKLKESQLAAYRMENDVVHQQRLREYCPAKNLEGSDPTEPVDAKQALFEGRSAKHEGQRGNDKTKSVDEQILTQNKNISSSLQHSKQLMTMLVMQTELNIDTLDQQSKDLMQLNDKLIDMETVLTKSREIIKFIERQDKHDKRRIYAAILFLLLCSAWVLWRRVLKVPVKMLVWTLLKMFGVVSW